MDRITSLCLRAASISGSLVSLRRHLGSAIFLVFVVCAPVASQPRDAVWVDDGLPAGAEADPHPKVGWSWVRGGTGASTHWIQGAGVGQARVPIALSGSLSLLSPVGNGPKWYEFSGATFPFHTGPSETPFVHVYLDPEDPPYEVKITWFGGGGASVSAWWGGPRDRLPGRRAAYRGPLPEPGVWTRLELPGVSLPVMKGMRLAAFDGRVAFDRIGKTSDRETDWIDDDLPSGFASVSGCLDDGWLWTSPSDGDAFSGLRAHVSPSASGCHEHGFAVDGSDALPVEVGSTLVTYVKLPSGAYYPKAVMLQFALDSGGVLDWEHKAYWGADELLQLPGGALDTPSRWFVGPLPPPDRWARLEVPASLLGLEGEDVVGMKFTLLDGEAMFDYTGLGPSPVVEEFTPNLASEKWRDVTVDFGECVDQVVGDGVADDWNALQCALDSLEDGEILYLPEGTYRITDTLVAESGVAGIVRIIGIVGKDPLTTEIRWDGTTGLVQASYGPSLPLFATSTCSSVFNSLRIGDLPRLPFASEFAEIQWSIRNTSDQPLHRVKIRISAPGNGGELVYSLPRSILPYGQRTGTIDFLSLYGQGGPGLYRFQVEAPECLTSLPEFEWSVTLKNKPAMLIARGLTRSKFSRITWDGNGAAHYGVFHTPPFDSGFEHSDEIFRDLRFGIRGGFSSNGSSAEVTVRRCQFLRCSEAGILTGGFNAYNWWVWESYFSGCKVGIGNNSLTSLGGSDELERAGDFHVYNSLFRGSTHADVDVRSGDHWYSVRESTSVGSARFFDMDVGNPSPVTLSGNKILDPIPDGLDLLWAPINASFGGPLYLLDNLVRQSPPQGQHRGHAVEIAGGGGANDKTRSALYSVGNTYTAAYPISPQLYTDIQFEVSLDDHSSVNPAQAIPWPTNTFPGPAPDYGRHIEGIDVEAANAADEIQNKIIACQTRVGERCIVAIPSGDYYIDKPIVFAENSDVQLIGDLALETHLISTDTISGNALLDLRGRNDVTVKDLMIIQADTAILVSMSDVPGSHLLADQLRIQTTTTTASNSVLVDGLDRALVEFRGSSASSHGSPAASVAVIGGDRLKLGLVEPGRVAAFGFMANSNPDPSFDLLSGGRLILVDVYSEGISKWLRFFSGDLTVSGGRVVLPGEVPLDDQVQVFSDSGRLTILGLELNAHRGIALGAAGADFRLLFSGEVEDHDQAMHLCVDDGDTGNVFSLGLGANFIEPYLDCGSGATWARVGTLARCHRPSDPLYKHNALQFVENKGCGLSEYTEFLAGSDSRAFLLEMLQQVRSERPERAGEAWRPIGGESPVSRPKLHRVLINASTGFGLKVVGQ